MSYLLHVAAQFRVGRLVDSIPVHRYLDLLIQLEDHYGIINVSGTHIFEIRSQRGKHNLTFHDQSVCTILGSMLLPLVMVVKPGKTQSSEGFVLGLRVPVAGEADSVNTRQSSLPVEVVDTRVDPQ